MSHNYSSVPKSKMGHFHSKQERLELIRELTSEGLSTRAIEAQTGISKSTVDRLIKQL